jgi:hypothetical protein
MLLEGVPRGAVRVVRLAGYWVGSVVGGGGGAFCGDMGYHSALFGVFFWRLEFSSVVRFFVIFCTFSPNSITLGEVVVVLWSSGGGCYPRSRACTKAPPCMLYQPTRSVIDCQSSLGTTKTARWIPTIITATAFGLAIDSCDQDVGV